MRPKEPQTTGGGDLFRARLDQIINTSWYSLPAGSTGHWIDQEIAPLIASFNAVGPENAGQKEASGAWMKLAAAEPRQLPEILAGLDDAGKLVSNWIPSAVNAIVERAEAREAALPRTELERFLFDTRHTPRARRLAYEILLRGDPSHREAPDGP